MKRLAMAFALILAGFSPAMGGVDKSTLCHIPPDDPTNAHTIVVSPSAVPNHLAHGDTLGECVEP